MLLFPNPITFSSSTHTAQDAANELGCSVSQIAKSLVFIDKQTQEPIIVIASGTNKVHLPNLKMASPQEVEKITGFKIGGVPPYGHKQKLKTLIDEDLFKHEVIWASAGTPNSVFQTTASFLQSQTEGLVTSLSEKKEIATKIIRGHFSGTTKLWSTSTS